MADRGNIQGKKGREGDDKSWREAAVSHVSSSKDGASTFHHHFVMRDPKRTVSKVCLLRDAGD